MTRERKEYAEMLGLMDKTENPVLEENRKLALQYVLSGSTIPQTLLIRLERLQAKA